MRIAKHDPDLIDFAYVVGHELAHNRGIVIAGLDALEERWLGLAASIPSAYERHLARIERERIAAKSQHVGTIGARETFTVRVSMVRCFETFYGDKWLVSMTTDDDHQLVTFTTGDFFGDAGDAMRAGKRIVIKGTVSEHGEYQGAKQTTVKRVSVVSDPEGLWPHRTYKPLKASRARKRSAA